MDEIDYATQPAKPFGPMRDTRTIRQGRKTFKALFCERFECPAPQFEAMLFRASLYRHALPFAPIISRFAPRFFDEDKGFIRDLGSTASRAEVLTELNRFYGRNVRDRNWIRKLFLIRISGKRVQRLSRTLFPPHRENR